AMARAGSLSPFVAQASALAAAPLAARLLLLGAAAVRCRRAASYGAYAAVGAAFVASLFWSLMFVPFALVASCVLARADRRSAIAGLVTPAALAGGGAAVDHVASRGESGRRAREAAGAWADAGDPRAAVARCRAERNVFRARWAALV